MHICYCKYLLTKYKYTTKHTKLLEQISQYVTFIIVLLLIIIIIVYKTLEQWFPTILVPCPTFFHTFLHIPLLLIV